MVPLSFKKGALLGNFSFSWLWHSYVFLRTQDIGMLFFAQIYCVSYLDMAFKQGALFRKLSFYQLWHSAQLSYKDIIKRDFLFSGESRFIFILVQMSRADLPFQRSILATQPGLISGTSPRICM